MKLNEITLKDGATKNSIRRGRGIGSGKGKTGGRGVKGQKSRSGVSIKGFEGGQMPLYRRLPKRGFNNVRHSTPWQELTLSKLEQALDSGLIKNDATLNEDELRKIGLVKKEGPVRLIGDSFDKKAKLNLSVEYVTPKARKTIEAAGGKVTVPEKKTPEKIGKKLQRRLDAQEKRAKRLEG